MNEVWEFKQFSNGKIELVGRMTPKDIDPAKLPGASHAVIRDGHTLVVRSSDGFAGLCRSCNHVGLAAGQTCGVIDEYNNEKHPL